jgi:competence protein ComEC
MVFGVVAFVVGVVLFMHAPGLPDPAWKLTLPVAIAIALRYSFLRLPVLLLCGFFWAQLIASHNLSTWLPHTLQGVDLQLDGVISGLPADNGTRLRFELEPSGMQLGDQKLQPPRRVMLSWYRTQERPSIGESWRFMVRLKRPHGFYNPGGFDYAGWLFQNRIEATGYVRQSEINRRLSTPKPGFSINRLRESIAHQIHHQLGEGIGAGILAALVVGIRNGIDQEAWRVFSRTGTNHLVAISGLHIGIVASLGFFLGRLAWRLQGQYAARFPAIHTGALCALLLAMAYAALAGFSTPTLRALVMVCAVLLTLVWRRTTDPFRGLVLALFVIVLIDPYAVLSPGFWLSFAAVGVIILAMVWRNGPLSGPWSWVRIQFLIAIGLAPVLVAWGFQVSLIAPLVNLVAVPMFTLILVPMALLGVVISQVWAWAGFALLGVVTWLLEQGYLFLVQVAEIPIAAMDLPQVAGSSLLLMVVGAVLLLLPFGLPGKGVGGLFLLSVLFWPQTRPGAGEFRLTVLDVGQGLAVVVETANRVLLYDTGPRFSSGFDAGYAVVGPFLKSRGVRELDTLMLSNGDMDHQGGLKSLENSFRIGRILSGEPQRIESAEVELCSSEISWNWDGVRFHVLHPGAEQSWKGNNASCVLLVHSPAGKALLTGDIEAMAEAELVKRVGDGAPLDLLIVPHHGSATSSTAAFVAWSLPRYAVVSAGYLNRYGFPRPEIRLRYQSVGTELLSTFESGAVTFEFDRPGIPVHPVKMRQAEKRLWIR